MCVYAHIHQTLWVWIWMGGVCVWRGGREVVKREYSCTKVGVRLI